MATGSDCPKCGGTGWIIVERASVSAAERCECRLAGRTARIEERSGIPPLYQNASFDNFSVPGQENPVAREDLARAFFAVKGFAKEFPNPARPGLLLIGEPGTGKTHLAVAALRSIMEKGFECLFWDYQELIERVRAGFDSTSASTDKEAYRSALDAEVLMIDDLGAQRTIEWVQDTITSIVTHRCNHGKPLIATTNLPDPDAGSRFIQRNSATERPEYRKTLAEFVGERARSRLFEMCTVVRIRTTEDYRVRKANRF